MATSDLANEVLYLIHEYESGDYNKKSFELKIAKLLKAGKISSAAAEMCINKIFKYVYDPDYGSIPGGCGSVARPHWSPSTPTKSKSSRYSSGSGYVRGTC